MLNPKLQPDPRYSKRACLICTAD